ncbi:hypothetical protein TPHA_0H00300 [Tetrapisispora phaffii CBS 4417]|uniref:eIF-2-alpha kinase activator GCN1 n=1 Tax=Tetrapisispora phaffii (strain ATCC 24235 / CBS 4417 / NBRC 1672 / NRRL Y-8282 / UCD 70-5) TaxID=1071381 RepID=G8BWT6_TETPH|nr:hypothetical protein TPHA_0H00300 [Tetrapisispora phaffii CBS 4417]CCE64240.1 hypothetical protein TPHA_0H00300 [Tetrapisispora phaffii CBS 4417]
MSSDTPTSSELQDKSLAVSWETLYSQLERYCYDSILNNRIPFLKKIKQLLDTQEKDKNVEIDQLKDISVTLLNTYSIYNDSKSKALVIEIFEKIIKLQSNLLSVYIKFIYEHTHKKIGSKATVDYLNLLEWVNAFYKIIYFSNDSTLFNENYKALIQAHTTVTNGIELSLSNHETSNKKSKEKQNQHRRRIRYCSLQSTTKTLTECFKSKIFSNDIASERLSLMLEVLISDYTSLSLSSTGTIFLLGSITKSCVQLQISKPVLFNNLKENYVEKFCDFIGKEVILGKNVPSDFCVDVSLRSFFNEFMTDDLVIKYIVPSLEKINLRAPALGFSLLRELYNSLNSQKVNILNIHKSTKLITQCFSSLKSSKETVRLVALEAILSLLNSISKDNYNADDLHFLINELFKNIKSNLNADYKIVASKIFINVPTFEKSSSDNIVNGLLPYISKESNEAALKYLLGAFFTHYFSLNENVDVVNKTITTGFNEKKINLKKIWFIEFMLSSQNMSSDMINNFIEPLLEFIKDTFEHSNKNNQSAILGCFTFINQVYKLNLEDTIMSINNIFENLDDKLSIGNAILQITLTTALSSVERLLAVQLTHDLFIRCPGLVGLSIIKSLEARLITSEIEEDDHLTYKFVTPLFNIISSELEDKAISSTLLIKALLISQYDQFRLRNGWAELVLHAKLSPSDIIMENTNEIIDSVFNILGNKELVNTNLATCALKAISYAAFVNPTAIVPPLSEKLSADLQTEALSKLTHQDIHIANGTEGEMIIDILDKDMAKKLADKNTKDYETLQWEMSIRKEQAKKANKKFTKEEQALIKEQIAKESEIRKNVNDIKFSLNRSIVIINQLSKDATLVDNGRDVWFPIAVSCLLELTQEANSYLLVGQRAIDAFLSLSNVVSERFGLIRLFIGVATLRVCNVQNIPENYLEEKLDELLSRVLFRIKFVCDQMPLDATSLTYLLPLLTHSLEEGKKVAVRNADKPVSRSDFVEEETEEEHLMLSMEIIGVHAEVFEDPSIPRVPIMKVLFSLLSLASKAKLARECLNALSQSISVSPTPEDLELLLSSLLSANPFVRSTLLEAIDNEYELAPYMKYSTEIFICRFDSESNNRELANFIWEFNKFEITEEMMNGYFNYFSQTDSGLRLFTAQSYTAASHLYAKDDKGIFEDCLRKLMEFYKEKAKPLKDIIDAFGLVEIPASERKDPWEARSTTAIALKEFSNLITEDGNTVIEVIEFLANDGPLGDRNSLVRQEMKETSIEVITMHGAEKVEELIPIFEIAIQNAKESSVKENVIISYGSLARHLESTDGRIHTIVKQLLDTLDTPSKQVQQAVAECLSTLVFLFRSQVKEYVNVLMEKNLDSSLPKAIRQGSAWGIAGLVKGYGIAALSEFDIIRYLIEAAENKKDPIKRESTAYSFEYLSKILGKFFEPYVIEVLPIILKNLGDSVPEVRDATADATRAIMANTTGFGVKKLIPVAVSNLEDMAWRTKRGSVELLGNMAYLDPAQLSSSLSIIVPEIVAVLNDSHKEVRKSADESLKRFGEVIRNPEIQKLVPTLLKAIGDPTKYTDEALDALIQTQFVHYIDGPSLALIIHIIHRGMHERSANTKRKACKIVGNMSILVDTKDLIPYLQQLINEVEIAMVDPVPNTRATAARALGALVERLGEEQFPGLIPRLLGTLSDEAKSGDRLGSAQALSEVISGLGISKLEELLPTIIDGATSFRPYVREGFMPMLLFLPVCFGAQFASYINQIIQPILAGLADTDENIQDTALKAGKLIVKNYATKAIDLLLPELEIGMFDENERIRLSSVQLTGELLFQVTGISSKNEFDEDEGDYSGEVSKKMVDVLGEDRRNRILSALFVCRNDTSGVVRASTVDIWKAIVPNTPRAVKEILPVLTNMIVANLASSSKSLRNIAANTLGDLSRRVGGNAMAQLLPTLENSLDESASEDSRQGVCVALTALIEPSSPESLEQYQDAIVTILRKTLTDNCDTVRQSAASTFDVYQDVVGNVAVDEVIPYLLHMLKSEEYSKYALSGLQEVMSSKSEVIFPVLIPTLLASPMDAFRASALGSLAEVAGTALYRRLSTIINTLVDNLVELGDSSSDLVLALQSALDKIFISVSDEDGLHPLLQQIMALLKSETEAKKIVVLERLPYFFENTVLDYEVYTPDIVSNCILSLDDKNPRVVKGNYETLTTLLKKQQKSMLEKLVKPAKQALLMIGTPGQDLAAFSLPRGPNCVLPIFLHGLMYGSNDEREASALVIADIVSKTPAANLKPFVSVITGPLIRVVGERFNSDIKAAILYALNILFAKIPQFLRPFIPQLQRTFVKSLSDPSNETLRLRAAKALGTLIEYQPRVDPLVIELVTGAKQTDDEGVKTAMLKALLEVVDKASSKLNETSKKNIMDLIEEEVLSSNEKLAVTYAKLIGSLSEILSTDEARNILKEKVLSSTFENETGKFGILTLNSFLKDAPNHIFETGLVIEFVQFIVDAMNSSNVYFSENGLKAAGKIMLLNGETKSPTSKIESSTPFVLGEDNIKLLIDELCKNMLKPNCNSSDCRRLSLVITRTLARFKYDDYVAPYFGELGKSVFSCLRDPVIPIKLAAEKAYLAVFKLVEEENMETFNAWYTTVSATGADLIDANGTTIQLRSIGDYTKRVSKRLATVERERIAAGGDAETMFSDRYEDETEIWAVGGVELNNDL